MKPLKHILLLTAFLSFGAFCFAQRKQIDSLEKLLPSLRDSARVDCLNNLSELHFNVQSEPKLDMTEQLASQALEEATKLNYMHGIAEAYQLKGAIALATGNNVAKVETFCRAAILSYMKTPNKKELQRAYMNLGIALHYQARYGEAIESYNKCYELSEKAGHSSTAYWSLFFLTRAYLDWGDYKRAVAKIQELHQIALTANDNYMKIPELHLISCLYRSIEDYNTALTYYRKIKEITPPDGFQCITRVEVAELYALNKQFDSARFFYRLVEKSNDLKTVMDKGIYLTSIGELYFLEGQYPQALVSFSKALGIYRIADRHLKVRVLADLAKTHLALNQNDSALYYSKELLAIVKSVGVRQLIRDSYKTIYSVYDRIGKKDSGLFYFGKYVAIKDSITSAEVEAKLVAYNFEQKIEQLNAEKEMQQATLEEESTMKNILFGTLLVFLLLGIVTTRYILLRRKNEKQLLHHEIEMQKSESERIKSVLLHQASELEMQALRSQMNPHFIFNSLNSINRFILQNNKFHASEYLTKFSKLMRLILQNSQADLIHLESELEGLRLYLELEALRFDHRFDYNISILGDIDTESIMVPPLIIQPYAENAIWHGLMHKDEKGHLDIEISHANDHLYIRIADDGIGREQAAALASKSATKHKSSGLKITANRIAMMNHANSKASPVTINDLVDSDGNPAGTEVIIQLPVVYG